MTIDRTTIISGPAQVSYGGQTFYSKGDIAVTFPVAFTEIMTSAFGRLDQRARDRRVVVSFEPDGRMTTALAAVLWPYAATATGASIYGASDAPLVIYGRDGIKLTLPAAAVTQMPVLRFAAGQTMIGPVTFTGLLKKDGDPNVAADLFEFASASYPGDTGYTPSSIYVTGAQATWDAVSMLTEAGAEIRFGLRLTEQAADGMGTVDMRVAGVDCSAAFTPVGVSAETLSTTMIDGNYGDAIASPSLIVEGIVSATGPPVITLSQARLTEVSARWGTPKRVGQCTWVAERTFTEADAEADPPVVWAMNPLWTFDWPT
jgi:hypothetical protein